MTAQSESIENSRRATDFLWQWGQFIDHDIDLTDGVDPGEFVDIAIPAGDVWFDPEGAGERVMSFNRSLHNVNSGTSSGNPRQQMRYPTNYTEPAAANFA